MHCILILESCYLWKVNAATKKKTGNNIFDAVILSTKSHQIILLSSTSMYHNVPPRSHGYTEKDGIASVLQVYVRKVLGSNLGHDVGYPEVISCFY
jgi:hypothetical protein